MIFVLISGGHYKRVVIKNINGAAIHDRLQGAVHRINWNYRHARRRFSCHDALRAAAPGIIRHLGRAV